MDRAPADHYSRKTDAKERTSRKRATLVRRNGISRDCTSDGSRAQPSLGKSQALLRGNSPALDSPEARRAKPGAGRLNPTVPEMCIVEPAYVLIGKRSASPRFVIHRTSPIATSREHCIQGDYDDRKVRGQPTNSRWAFCGRKGLSREDS